MVLQRHIDLLLEPMHRIVTVHMHHHVVAEADASLPLHDPA
jgi:hypothetical protein